MPKGKFGVRDFSDIDTTSTPPQVCDRPHEDDPFCGNDNNRRAHEAKLKREREAAGIQEPEAPVVQPAVAQVASVGDDTDPQPVAPTAAPSWTPRA